MSKENILSAVVGLLAGLVIGFVFANSVNQKGVAVPAAADLRSNSNMPPGHPEVGNSGTPGGTMQPGIQAAIDKAKEAPDDFAAQLKAAEAYYQIERFDDAVTYLKAANRIEPDDREVIVHLGNANFDANHFEEAEKWYVIALAKKDDVNVRTDLGLTFVFRDPPDYDRAIKEFSQSLAIDPNHVQTLQNLTVSYTKKGDAAKANTILARLENLDPQNVALAKLKEDLRSIVSK